MRDLLKKSLQMSCMAAACSMMLLLSSAAKADSMSVCEHLTLDVTAFATTTNPLGQYEGTVKMTLRDQTVYSANVVINPQGMPAFSADGTVSMQLRNQFSSPELASAFECYDHLTLIPVSGDPSRYMISNQAVIFNGSGGFSDAYGKLIATGEMAMAEGRISVLAEGRVCDIGAIR